MESQKLPSSKRRIILLGVGHTHAHILKEWKRNPILDTQLVCVSKFPIATYSGMLPAVLAGQYPTERMEIDLVRLAAANGAELVVADATGLDVERRELQFADRPPINYDLLSIGIGSIPSRNGIPVHSDRCIAIKPMQTFLNRLRRQIAIAANRSPLRIAVVGGGAGGVEIALCLPARMALELPDQAVDIHLVQGADTLLSGMASATAKRASSLLTARGIRVHLGRRVTEIHDDAMELEDGATIPTDLIIWATGAAPPLLLGRLGLPTDRRGFLATDASLQVVGHAGIFAVGDTGSIEGVHYPKSGVFAVRQGPILWDNLNRATAGQPLREFHPQRRFLKLLNTGDGRAIAEYAGLSWTSRLNWWWKHAIDTSFMAQYQDYADD